MGECGCGGTVVEWFKFPAPKGEFYLIGVYPSCEDCTTPAGVDLRRVSKKQHEEETGVRLSGVRDLDWHNGFGHPASELPVLHPNALRRHLKDFLKGTVVDGEPLDDIGADTYAEEAVRECFREAVYETAKEPSHGE